jgi:hypothetical protein
MALRGRLALASILSILYGTAACGGTSFEVAGSDAGLDGGAGQDEASPRMDSRATGEAGKGSRDGATRDAQRDGDRDAMSDASGPDSTVPHDARSDIQVSPPDAVGVDAPVLVDASSPKDAGTKKDAATGPACLTKTADVADGVLLISGATPPPPPVDAGVCGSYANPCTDLASAIPALGTGTNALHIIYVGNGTHVPAGGATSFPSLPDGITLQGGWNVTDSESEGYRFNATCDVNATFSSAGPSVFTVGTAGSPSTGKVVLNSVDLKNIATPPTPSTGGGESLYGIFAVGTSGPGGSTLSLNDVTITVANGGQGADGGGGPKGPDGALGGCPLGVNQTPATPGAVGMNGGAGANVTYSASGTAAAEGATGTQGGVGTAGAVGAEGCSNGNATKVCHAPTLTEPMICSFGPALAPVCTAAPNGGCPGMGGEPGQGGFGGGSSVAVYMWGGNLQAQNATLDPGVGGTGGAGGLSLGGGNGAPTGQLPLPTSFYYNITMESCSYSSMKGACEASADVPLVAMPGKPGATGGTGGQGGGGAGGDSYGYYLGGGAQLTADSTMISFGPTVGGQPGVPNMPNGTVGKSGSSGP